MIPISKLKPKKRRSGTARPIREGFLIAPLKKMREERLLSLRECAAASGIDVSSLHRMERGAEPSLRIALMAAAFYEMPVEKIWRLTE